MFPYIEFLLGKIVEVDRYGHIVKARVFSTPSHCSVMREDAVGS